MRSSHRLASTSSPRSPSPASSGRRPRTREDPVPLTSQTRLTREDLQADSPYNTYRRQGLPPGPIASPGRAAIQAAVRPASVRYLYFVATDDRHHQFSSNLADHNAAVARYRLARTK